MATTTNQPVTIPADSSSVRNSNGVGPIHTNTAGKISETHTLTLSKITANGATGSVTIKDGAVTSWTPPT